MTYWIYYHQLDPFLIQFTETFGIRWYSLAYIVGVLSAYYLAFFFIKKGRLFLPASQILDIVTYGAIGAIIGGRIGYCLFYAPYLLTSFDSSFPFWGLLKIHEGGMASHGGILGLVISQLIYSYYRKVPFLALMDLAALGGSIGLFLGRIANFINGELYGRVVENKALLGVKFPSEIFLWIEQSKNYKEQLLSLKSLLPNLSQIPNFSPRLPSSYMWEDWVQQLAQTGSAYRAQITQVCHWIVENSAHPQIRAGLEPLLFIRHPSQFYQSFFGGLIPLIVICILWSKPRSAGTVAISWVFIYLLGRIFTEFFRLPDAEIGYQLFNLTRGQWLSFFLLILLSTIYFTFFYGRDSKKQA